MHHNTEDPITILIVDDNAMSRSILRDFVEFMYPTCRVWEAENGKTGLALAQTQEPDLILLDLSMPVMNGYEMAVALQATTTTQQIPLILCTCEDSSDPLVVCLRHMCQEVLSKPLSLDNLKGALKQIVAPSATPLLPMATSHA